MFIDQATLNGTRANSPSGVKPARQCILTMAWATALTYASAGASSLEVDLLRAASQQLPISPTEDEPATGLQLVYLPGSDDAHAFAQASA